MRPLRFLLVFLTAAIASRPAAAQQARVSPHETFSAVLGDRHSGNRVTVVYGRPYSKDPKTGEIRKIWGGLVPYGEAYRLGADEATLFVTEKPIVFPDATLPAGAYTLYLVPSDTGATKLAFSSNVGKWGSPVDETHDVTRVDMERSALAAPVDQLTLSIDKGADGNGTLRVRWETTEFSLLLRAPAPRVDFPQASPASTLRQRVGVTDVEVVYSRPSARGRTMLGGLNPYGEVWRTGANSATRISFSTPVTFQGAAVAAGSYELFTIPGKDTWTVILQKASGQWGAYAYDPKKDVLRVTATPVALAQPLETFQITFGDLRDDSATLNLEWEAVRVPVKLGFNVVDTIVPQINAVMAGSGTKPYLQSALFYLDHDLDLAKAKGWIDAEIAAHPDQFYYYYHKARLLAKMGDKPGALEAARKSIDLASKATGPEKDEYIRLNEALIARLK